MKPVNFSDVDIANIVEAVIKDDPDAIMIKDSFGVCQHSCHPI